MPAFYRKKVGEFLTESANEILGTLLRFYQHNELQKRQTKAWETEISLLKAICTEIVALRSSSTEWSLLLEYPIPRRAKRLDAVLLASDVILCLEFKTLDKAHSVETDRQVEDYALDLRDFHEASLNRRIVPIAIVPKAALVNECFPEVEADLVRPVRRANEVDLAKQILTAFNREHQSSMEQIKADVWDNAAYHPVPTIIEAAEALYAGHGVSEIAHYHADAQNLTSTSRRIEEIIDDAQRHSGKVICFVTGVPGAGKTLAGLNIANSTKVRSGGRRSPIFLSGNGPLVKIITAALAQDAKLRTQNRRSDRSLGAKIQNVHSFVRAALQNEDRPPFENIIIFDEAQRAWDIDQNRKKNGLETSEPETILSIMDRNKGWAVIVALVGGGQEIYDGESGLAEWGKTLREKFPKWKVIVSPKILEKDVSTAGHRLFPDNNMGTLEIQKEPFLHLEVNLRSFRARKFAEWVDAALAGDFAKASATVPALHEFPFALTRSLKTARAWLRTHARGQQRAGLVASSKALRLRTEGLELSTGFRRYNGDMFVHWFLRHRPDVRASSQLEVAASEFECQGLELDWVGLCWGGDFSIDILSGSWAHRRFSGRQWQFIKDETNQRYLLNTYRVLLTRARRGLILWVPQGNAEDPTNQPALFNSTAEYLIRCGVPLI